MYKKKEKSSVLVEVEKFELYAVAKQIIEHFIENNFYHSNHYNSSYPSIWHVEATEKREVSGVFMS